MSVVWKSCRTPGRLVEAMSASAMMVSDDSRFLKRLLPSWPGESSKYGKGLLKPSEGKGASNPDRR